MMSVLSLTTMYGPSLPDDRLWEAHKKVARQLPDPFIPHPAGNSVAIVHWRRTRAGPWVQQLRPTLSSRRLHG